MNGADRFLIRYESDDFEEQDLETKESVSEQESQPIVSIGAVFSLEAEDSAVSEAEVDP